MEAKKLVFYKGAIMAKKKKIMRFTEPLLKSLETEKKEELFYIGENLFFKVYKSGSKAFVYKDKDIRKTIGKYPDISLSEARELAFELKVKKKAEQAKPPVPARLQISFIDLFEKYLIDIFSIAVNMSEKNKAKNIQTWKSMIINYAKAFKDKPFSEVTLQDLLQLFDTLKTAGIGDNARKLLGKLKKFYKWAMMRQYIDIDLTHSLEPSMILLPRSQKHMSAITDEESVKKLIDDIYSYKGNIVIKTAGLIALFTALRSSSLRRAKWADIDLKKGIWQIKASDMKKRRDFTLYLHPIAKRLLKNIKAMHLSDVYVFPALLSSSKDAVISDNTIRQMFRRLGWDKESFSVHGLRSTFSTLCNKNYKLHGLSPDIIELCSARKKILSNDTSDVYNRYDFEKEKETLFLWYGDYLACINPLLETKLEGKHPLHVEGV